MTFADRVFEFYKGLSLPQVPQGVEVMNPYLDPQTQKYSQKFLNKYFSDNNKRVFVFGINPGRFGAGITGVTFTDPVALATYCEIPNTLAQKKELSSEFVYQFIKEWGGVEKFYKEFFLTAISPLGFVKNGKNYNYYDDKDLLTSTMPFIVDSTQKQIKIGGHTHAAILFGTGKNQKVFEELNNENKFFDKVYALEHPRFIMQYKRRFLSDYLKRYIDIFAQAQV